MLIAFPRSLAQRFRAVLRRCTDSTNAFRAAVVTLRAFRQGLSLEAVLDEAALRLEHPGSFTDETFRFPVSVLALFEGKADAEVTLEALDADKCRVSWAERGSVTQRDFDLITSKVSERLTFPAVPSDLTSPGQGFHEALREASLSAGQQAGSRALHRVQLRGTKGVIVGTDGKLLLMQRGFRFPWRDEILIPGLNAWGSRELPDGKDALVGSKDPHVFVRLGPWTFALAIDAHGRYPPVDSIVPHPRGVTCRLLVSEEDAAVLLKELPRLPGRAESPAPVTLEAGKTVSVRARLEVDDPHAVEVRLKTSKAEGKPVTLVTDRRHILRALNLGFREVEIVRADVPVCCRDSSRVLVWMPLGESKPAPQPVPGPFLPPPKSPSITNTLARKEAPPMPDTNGRHALDQDGDGTPSAQDPLAEAEAIRSLLSEAQNRLSRLIGSLKSFRKQSRAVRAAVLSLRDLPPLTP